MDESGLIQIDLDGLIINVDSDTARLLNEDPVFRENYGHAIRTHCYTEAATSELHSTPCTSTRTFDSVENINFEETGLGSGLVWTTKKNTDRDICATTYFLQLRKQYSNQFQDQKHSKTTLWQIIAKEMQKKTFMVGEGIEGAEKCRKKFANLQATYMKYKDKKRQTGQGNIMKPPFFDDMEEILGGKDKVVPPLIIDSLQKENSNDDIGKTVLAENISTGNLDITVPPATRNKFTNIKTTVRPDKNKILSEFLTLQREDNQDRKKEFDRIMTYLEMTSAKRHEEVMSLLKNDRGSDRVNKRKKNNCSSDSDN